MRQTRPEIFSHEIDWEEINCRVPIELSVSYPPLSGVQGLDSACKEMKDLHKNKHYNKSLQERARELRNNMTKSEACMWKYVLSGRQMLGYQFRRQRPVLKYIADFMCKDLMLIVEVDGISHDSEECGIKDKQRDKCLSEIGFTTLRFSSWEVLHKIDMVSGAIVEWINENAICPPPGPRQRGTS